MSTDGTSSLSNFAISKDGKYLAYGISKSGSDWVEIFVLDIERKVLLSDQIKWVKFSGIAWKGNGFYYSRYQEPTENKAYVQKNEFHKVYYHELGKSQSNDKLVYENNTHPDWNFSAQVTQDENYLIIYTSESTSGQMFMIKDL
jgi:prolyl oligopeptidase